MKIQTSVNETSTNLQYLNANNLHEWAMTQKLPMLGFVCEKVDKEHLKELHKNYNSFHF